MHPKVIRSTTTTYPPVNRNLVTAFGAIASSRLAIVLISVAFAPLLVRLLGFESYGAYAAVIALFDLLMIPVSSGVISGCRKYIAEDRDTAEWHSYIFAYYFRRAALLALIAMISLVAAVETGLVGHIYPHAYTPYFVLLAGLVIAAQFREYTRRALMGLKLEHIGEPLNVVYRGVFACLALALAALGFGVAGVLVAQIVASLLGVVLALIILTRHLSLTHLLKRIPDSYPTTAMRSFNYQSVVYIFLLASLYKVDQVLLGTFASGDQVGYYRAALVLVQFLWFVPRSLQSLLLQSTSDLWANGRTDVIEALATRAARYVLLLTMLLALGLGALAPVFVPLYYGTAATPAIQVLWILLPGTVGVAVTRPLLTITHANGDMTVLIAATGAAAVINLVGNMVLIPPFGPSGAAIATTLGYGALPLFQVWGARSVGYRPFKNARLLQIGITTLFSGIGIVGLAVILGTTTFETLGSPVVWGLHRTPLALVVVPPVGFLLYSGLAIATGAITVGELHEILDRVPRPLGSPIRSFLP